MEEEFVAISNIINECIKINNSKEVFNKLKQLTLYFKQDDVRTKYEFVHGSIFSLLKHLQSNQTSVEREEVLTSLFSCIRNAVAASEYNQNLCAETPGFCETVWGVMCINFELLGSGESYDEELKEKIIATLRCGIQFLGNTVVQNSNTKSIVWNLIKFKVLDFLRCKDEGVARYSSMLVYNCLFEMPVLVEDVISNYEFTVAFVELMSNSSSEWDMYTLQYLLKFKGFIPVYYSRLTSDSKEYILHLLENEIKSENSSDLNLVGAIDRVADIYLEKCNIFYNSELQSEQDICEILNLLDVLGKASSVDGYSQFFREKQSILVASVMLLRAIHEAGKQGNHFFKPVQISSEEAKHHPAYGFKRDLISLIGNLCYRHERNQNEVRELNGIQLLLDCAKIDTRNLFIIEWVVLAIRNLCENNLENQAVIGQLRNQGCEVSDEIIGKLENLKIEEKS